MPNALRRSWSGTLPEDPNSSTIRQPNASKLAWIEIGSRPEDFTPVPYETTIDYWKHLHTVIEAEPPYEAYRMYYGELAALGIEKGKPFAPDARMAAILEKAAKIANAQMRVQSFADQRPERIAWPDHKWK